MSDNKVKGDRYTQTEFYMRRGARAYFRNEYGKKIMYACTPEYLSSLVYGEKYDFKINRLIRDLKEIGSETLALLDK